MRSFAIVIRRAYFEAKKRRNYAKNVVVNRSDSVTDIQVLPVPIQPKTFRFPQRSFDYKKHEQRRV